MDGYEPADELCPVCRATLLVKRTAEDDHVCPNCEDWRREVSEST
jgi:uncharacterized protein YbaR (Trm112 family)